MQIVFSTIFLHAISLVENVSSPLQYCKSHLNYMFFFSLSKLHVSRLVLNCRAQMIGLFSRALRSMIVN